ncbi:hypothetical protein B7463_g4758, partial [Scytalidium lignicola]
MNTKKSKKRRAGVDIESTAPPSSELTQLGCLDVECAVLAQSAVPLNEHNNDIRSSEETPRSSFHVYLSPCIEVLVGPEQQKIPIHRGVLSQSPVLESMCYEDGGTGIITIPKIGLELFILIATYLYTGDYRNSASLAEPATWAGYSDPEKLRKHVQIYCYSKNYKLERLSELACSNIEASREPELQDLFSIANEAYEHLPLDDTWFFKYFRTAIRRGLENDPKLPEQPWILTVIEGGGRMAADVFSTLVLRKSGIDTTEIPQQIGTMLCPSKSDHLARLGKGGSWNNCEPCKRDRTRLLSLGSTILTLVISEQVTFLDPTNDSKDPVESNNSSGENIGIDGITIANEGKKTKRNKERKKQARQLRALVEKPGIKLLLSILSETMLEQDWSCSCPIQKEHLRKAGGKWLWEDCPRCQQDRALMMDKIHQLGFPREIQEAEIEQDDKEQTTKRMSHDKVVTCNTVRETSEAETGDSNSITYDEVTESELVLPPAEGKVNTISCYDGGGQESDDFIEVEQAGNGANGGVAYSDPESLPEDSAVRETLSVVCRSSRTSARDEAL